MSNDSPEQPDRPRKKAARSEPRNKTKAEPGASRAKGGAPASRLRSELKAGGVVSRTSADRAQPKTRPIVLYSTAGQPVPTSLRGLAWQAVKRGAASGAELGRRIATEAAEAHQRRSYVKAQLNGLLGIANNEEMLSEHRAMLKNHERDEAFRGDFVKACNAKLRWTAAWEKSREDEHAKRLAEEGRDSAKSRDIAEKVVDAMHEALIADVEKVELLMAATRPSGNQRQQG